jgi:hypothetical protein
VIRHLLVIGGQRCGTTYLHTLLEAHPGIAMARPARPEPKVFCSDALADRGREWYVATYFAHAGDAQVLGEKSTSYIEDPEAPARVRRTLGEASVLAVLRDPVARAVSNWRFTSDHGLESRPLEQALAESLEEEADWDRSATSVSPFAYLSRGRYVEHLRPWLAAFPDRVRVVFLPELLEEASSLADLYAWLGVDDGFRPAETGRVVNASSEAPPALPEALSRRLRAYYASSDEALGTVLGRPVPWVPGNETRGR